MPELPEVETARRILNLQLGHRTIESVRLEDPRVVASPSSERFSQALIHCPFGARGAEAVSRRGKFLLFPLPGDRQLVIHLRMTGRILVAPPSLSPRYLRLSLTLSDGNELRLEDPRRLGRVWLLEAGEEDAAGLNRLGTEPWDPAFSANYLQACWKKHKKKIKLCLLDQTVVCGIGNIYSDEILFAAGIRPDRPADTLSDTEWQTLAAAIPRELTYFTEKNAISPQDYVLGHGHEYRNTPFLRVYGRDRQPCTRCGRPLIKTRIGGRSSVYCETCQR